MSFFPKGGKGHNGSDRKKPFFKNNKGDGDSTDYFKNRTGSSASRHGRSSTTHTSPTSTPAVPPVPSYTPPKPREASSSRKRVPPSGKDPMGNLNKEQYMSATLPSGRNLVIASAGTGKTSTIVGRMGYLLSCGVYPEEILLLTFTSKAADEMRERIESFVGSDVADRMMIGTFHSVSLKILRKAVVDKQLKTPRDVMLIFKSIYEHRTIIPDENAGVKPYGYSALYEKYGLFLNAFAGEGHFSDWVNKSVPEHNAYAALYDDIIDEFEKTKEKEKIYDFNDLLFLAKKHFKANGCPFREIIVDEYQDTNPLQSSLLDEMNPESLFCVGDYDQSIYSFNGSDIAIIGSFADRYPGARVQTLTKNYRSSKSILNLAERVINQNPRLFPKNLEVMSTVDPIPPVLFTPEDGAEQILSLVDEIIKLNEFEETAVIYRTNSSGDPVELALKERSIPCVRKGGKGIFDSKEMLSTIAMAKILFGDKSLATFLQALDIAPIRSTSASLVHSTLRYLGPTIRLAISDPDLSQKNNAFNHVIANTAMGRSSITTDPSRKHISGCQSSKWVKHPVFEIEHFNAHEADLLFDLFDLIHKVPSDSSPGNAIDTLISSKILKTMLSHYAAAFSRDKEGKIIQEQFDLTMKTFQNKLNVLKNIAASHKSHDTFLRMITMKSDNDQVEGAVQLLTVHASKGLEFKNVFLVDLIEDVFPNKKLMTGGGGMDEERRLFYVAATRPKERLICFAPKRIRNRTVLPSRFLAEGGLV